jgi:hypothetical protein
MEYLMLRGRRATFRSFILASYKPEKEMLADLKQKATTRKLLPIESRMLTSINASWRLMELLRVNYVQIRRGTPMARTSDTCWSILDENGDMPMALVQEAIMCTVIGSTLK